MRKDFKIEAVLSAITGTLLCDFGDMHEVYDHYYPGIMTLGVALMADQCRERVLEEHPGLKGVLSPDVGGATGDAYLEAIAPWLREMREAHGEELTLTRDMERNP